MRTINSRPGLEVSHKCVARMWHSNMLHVLSWGRWFPTILITNDRWIYNLILSNDQLPTFTSKFCSTTGDDAVWGTPAYPALWRNSDSPTYSDFFLVYMRPKKNPNTSRVNFQKLTWYTCLQTSDRFSAKDLCLWWTLQVSSFIKRSFRLRNYSLSILSAIKICFTLPICSHYSFDKYTLPTQLHIRTHMQCLYA